MPGKPKGLPKTGGRQKGSTNKTTAEIRGAYQAFVENNIPNFEKWIERVAQDNPAKALELVTSLSEYFLPKLQRTETDITTKGESVNRPIIDFGEDKNQSESEV